MLGLPRGGQDVDEVGTDTIQALKRFKPADGIINAVVDQPMIMRPVRLSRFV